MRDVKLIQALLIVSSVALSTTAFATNSNDNLAGAKLCVDNDSFTAGIGGLSKTSDKLAQGLYDYFMAKAAAKKISVEELGDKSCPDYAVTTDFGATTGTPRAWYGALNVYDSSSYFSPKATDTYKYPVSVWVTSSYGVLEDNQGIDAFLMDEGKLLIDEFLKAYLSVN